ncbi:HK97 gp10 family phage protein [uncultured Halomonas sp.]|uniref:HK97 gp10 family phage protein n=1 Tax=uncultured Halomonas sp. TaxID=173971 RepID=UPI00263567F0|nr:HK97 gp10 family phage protein [uncultured Halomonas sp.]
MAVIKVDELAGEIVLAIQAYTEDVSEAIDQAARDTAKALAKDLRETSPKDTGEYAKGWTHRKEAPGSYRVYNKKKPQLTHLLEHGHAKAGGGRVEGIPHIKPAEDRYVPEFEKKVQQILERGG